MPKYGRNNPHPNAQSDRVTDVNVERSAQGYFIKLALKRYHVTTGRPVDPTYMPLTRGQSRHIYQQLGELLAVHDKQPAPLRSQENPMPTSVQLPDTLVQDLLSTALEGATHYWSTLRRYGDGPLRGGEITVTEWDDNRIKVVNSFTLDYRDIARGLQIMLDKYPKAFAGLFSADAHTADLFIQCCCFGEEKYA